MNLLLLIIIKAPSLLPGLVMAPGSTPDVWHCPFSGHVLFM